MYDLIIRNGKCFTPSGLLDTDIGVQNSRITAIGFSFGVSTANEFDANGLHVLPGIIDTHVHFREPGLEQQARPRT